MFSTADKTVKPSVRIQQKTEGSFFESQKKSKISASESNFFQPAIQPKLSVNKPDDAYEQEADLMAEKVVNMPEANAQSVLVAPPDVQLQEQENEEEEETIQGSTISAQRMTEEEEENSGIQTKRISLIQRNENSLQAASDEEEDSVQTYSSQRSPSMYHSDVIQMSGRGPPATAGVQFQDQLHISTSGGRPMSRTVGDRMSDRFGADFSSVRIHTDTSAQQMSKQLNAHAFTYGNHLYFNSGKYDPSSKAGQTLLAHELTHTIQQGASPLCSNSRQKHNFTAVQKKSILQRQVAPQLTAAVELAQAEQGKVIANKEGADGYRYGWEHLIEYFETTFGKDKIVSQPTGEKNIVPRQSIKKKSEFYGDIIDHDGKLGKGMRDAMPSWCGIFAFWALNKAGIPMPKWKLGEAFIPPEAAYPPGHTPKPGDLAFKQKRSHYGLVVGMDGPNRVKSVNGNTAGDDNLGGEIQVQTHDLSNWHAYFNPLVAKTGNLRDPKHGDEDTEPKSLDELLKEKFNVSRKAENESEEEEELQTKAVGDEKEEEEEQVQTKSEELEEEETIQRSEIGNTGGFASNGVEYAADEDMTDIQTKAESTSLAMQVRNKSSGPMIQGGWLGDAWNAVSGLASDVADLIEEGIDAAKDWIIEKVVDFVNEIPGYTLLSYILGHDPITRVEVNKTPLTLLDAVLDIIPIGGEMVKSVLEYFQAVNPVANWLFDSVARFSNLISSAKSRFTNFWNSLSISDAGDPERVISDVANLFQSVVTDVVSFVGEVGKDFLIMVKDIAVSNLASFVKTYFPNAYDLLIVIFGEDPITKEPVERNGTNILNAALKVLGERGAQIKQQMIENGIFEKCVGWIDRSINLVLSLVSDIGNIFDTLWDVISFESLFHPIETFTQLAQAFTTPIERIITFMTDAMVELIAFLREALLEKLSNFAKEQRGYFLITVLIGIDPFTKKRVLRNTENIIHGFFSLMDGGEAQFQQMKESGKIDQMTEKINKAVKQLNFTLEYVLGLFISLWESLDWNDFLKPFDVFKRIVATFGDPVIRLIRFIITVVKIAIEILLIAMNFPIDTVNNIIQKSLEAFGNIKRDPIGFLINILKGIKQGFVQFFANILKHLLSGLADWLFGSLGDLGIKMPPDLSFKSILNLVLEILGISVERIMERVWLKLTEQIGAEKVEKIKGAIDKLTGIWTFVKDVIDRGPIIIWEYVQEKLSELWNIVLDAAKGWIMTKIISEVTAKLLSMLDPTGIMAVINSVIAIYRAIQSFIEQLRAMLEIFNSFVNGVAEIAAGNIKVAADYLEGAMARGIPVLIGFLANQVGLGGIGRKLAEIIGKVREKITEGIDWLVEKALKIGRPIIDGVLRVIEFGEGVVEKGKEKVKGAIAGLVSWWKSKITFEADDGRKHELYFQGEDDASVLVVASNPQPFSAFINSVEVGTDVKKQEAKTNAQSIAAKIDAKKRERVEGNNEVEKDKNAEKKKKEIDKLLSDLGSHAKDLFGASEAELPTSVKTHQSANIGGDTMGTFMEANPLTKKGSGGSTPTSRKHEVFDKLLRRRKGGSSYYVRGHLLNHNTHGPGTWENMTPLSKDGNSSHESQVESLVKAAVSSGAIVKYTVKPEYTRGSLTTPADADPALKDIRDVEKYVPLKLDCEAAILEKDGEGFKKKQEIVKKEVKNDIDTEIADYELTSSVKERVSLTKDTVAKIVENTSGIIEGRLSEIQIAAKSIDKLNTYDQIKDKFTDKPSTQNDIEKLRVMSNVVLN